VELSGHVVEPLKVKLLAIEAFVPELGTDAMRFVLPMFERVTLCGLSVLAAPTAVEAKLMAEVATATLRTRAL
jgi:hypothetical protein